MKNNNGFLHRLSEGYVRRLLLSIDNSELIIVISTHSLGDIDELLSDVLILHDGKLAVSSSIESIAQEFPFTSVSNCDNSFFTEGFQAISRNRENEDTDVDIDYLWWNNTRSNFCC